MRPPSARSVLIALPLALGAIATGAGSASANSSSWGDNGSGTCSAAISQSQLGQYCMQSVTGWIQINGGQPQYQAVSCSNNAPGGSPGLSWSLDGQSYTTENGSVWPQLAAISDQGEFAGWQTGNGSAYLNSQIAGSITAGSASSSPPVYGTGQAAVDNLGGSGYWQAAVACLNAAGASAISNERGATRPSAQVANAAPVRIRDKTIDTVDGKNGKAFRAREYALKQNVTRTDTRTCPAGMVRKGKLAYTVQEFPANGESPRWKDRALVDVQLTPKGRNAGMVEMTLTKAKNPTVVQFQMRCAKA